MLRYTTDRVRPPGLVALYDINSYNPGARMGRFRICMGGATLWKVLWAILLTKSAQMAFLKAVERKQWIMGIGTNPPAESRGREQCW